MRAVVPLLAALSLSAPAVAQPTPGTCAQARAEAVLDGNAVTASLFNGGNLFFGNATQAGYYVDGASPVFSASLWLGGIVDGEVRTAGATYSDYEFWPGPLGADGRPVDPDDCAAYDRIYTVSQADVAAYEAGEEATADLADWPVELGAPVLDGDGIEGNYALAAGDRPDLGGGGEAAFWVMNDVGNAHRSTGSAPLGVEVRVLAVAPLTGDARLDKSTVYRYEVVNKSGEAIEGMRAGLFVDPDLGSIDDYIGSDPEREMVYTYEPTDYDRGGDFGAFGLAPPAVGTVLLDASLSGALYFINSGPPELSDPSGRAEYFCVLQGLTSACQPYTDVLGEGTTTRFAFSGDPIRPAFWSERCTDSDCESRNSGSDRRYVAPTEAWRLAPGASRTVTFAVVYGRSEHHLLSVAALRNAADAVRAWHDDRPLPEPLALADLPAPDSLRPAPRSLAAGDTMQLSWDAVPGATGYTVHFATDAAFDEALSAYTVGENALRLTADECAAAGVCNREVYWRVQAYGAAPAALSASSETSSVYFFVPTSPFAADGVGIVEVASPSGDVCAVVDEGCRLGYGNTVFLDPNAQGDYFVGPRYFPSESLSGSAQDLVPRGDGFVQDDIEIRFTEACLDEDAPCYGVYWSRMNGQGADGPSYVARVPFEAYAATPDGDVRLIPLIHTDEEDAAGETVYPAGFDWADYFPADVVAEGSGLFDALTPGARYAMTDELFLYYPSVDEGYARFAAAAAASGGAGAVYADEEEPSGACRFELFYADFCRGSEFSGVVGSYAIGRLAFADYAEDGTTPEAGTVIRFYNGAALPPALPGEPAPPQPEDVAFGLGVPYPNPASGRLTVPFRPAEAGPVRLAVYDVLGREVALLRSGEQSAEPDAALLDVGALAPGVYLVVLETAGRQETRRFTVAR